MEQLGVKISKLKSYYPTEKVPFQAEFAKRIFNHEGELSPLPLRLLKESVVPKELGDGFFLRESIDRDAFSVSDVDRIPGSFITSRSVAIAASLTSDNAEIDEYITSVLNGFDYKRKDPDDELHFIRDDKDEIYPHMGLSLGVLRRFLRNLLKSYGSPKHEINVNPKLMKFYVKNMIRKDPRLRSTFRPLSGSIKDTYFQNFMGSDIV